MFDTELNRQTAGRWRKARDRYTDLQADRQSNTQRISRHTNTELQTTDKQAGR